MRSMRLAQGFIGGIRLPGNGHMHLGTIAEAVKEGV